MVRLPVSRKDLIVMATSMADLPCQVMGSPNTEGVVYDSVYTVQISPVSAATKAVRGDRGRAPYEIVFMAMAPPLGYNTYFVRYSKLGSHDPVYDHMIPIIRFKALMC